MQDFFNLGDEEENEKLIWCIGKKKIAILTKQTDIENFQTNYFALTQLGLNHPLSGVLPCPRVPWTEGWSSSPPRAGLSGQTTCPITRKARYCFKSSLESF